MRRRLLWLSVAWLGARSAAADTCGPVEGFDAVFPVPDDVDLPVNAVARVRYLLGEFAPDGGELTVTADGVAVVGTTRVEPSARELSFEPSLSYLPPGSHVEVTAPRADGESGTFSWGFDTALDRDTDPPVLDPIDDIDWEWLGGGAWDDPCGPEEGPRYRVTLTVPPALDGVDRDEVEYLVFRTNGPDAEEGPVLDGIGLDDGSGTRVEASVYLPGDSDYARKLCFTLGARDVTVINFTSSPAPRCVRLKEGPFFQSICSAAPGHGQGAGAGLLLVALGAAGMRRRP